MKISTDSFQFYIFTILIIWIYFVGRKISELEEKVEELNEKVESLEDKVDPF